MKEQAPLSGEQLVLPRQILNHVLEGKVHKTQSLFHFSVHHLFSLKQFILFIVAGKRPGEINFTA